MMNAAMENILTRRSVRAFEEKEIPREELEQIYHVKHLPSDFKKKNGYKRSTELSREYGLYRQDYCGCVFSKMERERQKADSQQQ